ncbi:MAG: acyltransferase family protein, partial [Candidatus Limnocylindrales bacterium]
MTIFFVLAGFLAARSYLSIRRRQEARTFTAFWTRRARRLLPITTLGLAFAALVTLAIGSSRAQQSLAGDVTSVVANVSNWRFMIDDRSYGAMFENPSAFQHLWSLSVEEQWFLLIPVVLAVAALVGSRREAWGRHVVAAAAVALGLIPLVIAHTPDQAYFGTHVRGAEFLAGVWLALWLSHRDSIGWQPAQRRALAIAGSASLVLLVAVMLLVDRNQPWLYRGGMGLFAVPAALVVAACVTGAPTLERALGIAPLRWLGIAALSIYVLHWPLFQVVEHLLPDTAYVTVVAVQLAVAIGIGSAVHVLIERPLLPPVAGAARLSAPSNRLVLVPAVGAMAVL